MREIKSAIVQVSWLLYFISDVRYGHLWKSLSWWVEKWYYLNPDGFRIS